RDLLRPSGVSHIIDVWCEPAEYQYLPSLLLPSGTLGGVAYRYTIGVHPHEASLYTDNIHNEIVKHLAHPQCVSLGEIGLDYHYDNSPREVQREVLRRQLRALTVHTREADVDVWRILREELGEDRERRIHIHCFSDTVELAKNLLDFFPNLYIGITGVTTYPSNVNTPAVLAHLVRRDPDHPRFLLETDSPYMLPNSLQVGAKDVVTDENGKKHTIPRLWFSLSSMIPWTAEFVANKFNETIAEKGGSERKRWTTAEVLRVGEENARFVYGL
ncbi:Metallo-dependent hydrolase, partial [Atractiella rhizophila]